MASEALSSPALSCSPNAETAMDPEFPIANKLRRSLGELLEDENHPEIVGALK